MGSSTPIGPVSIEVAVFPLATSFFPTTSMPLQIFEPRYLKMVEDSFDTDRPIAVSFDDPTDRTPASLRLIAGIGKPVLLEKRKDGRMIILLRGEGKVRIGRVIQKEPYLICEARTVTDQDQLSLHNRFRMNRYLRYLVQWLGENVKEERNRAMLLSGLDTPARQIEFLATHVISDPSARQLLLEKDDINDRLSVLQYLDLDRVGPELREAQLGGSN